MRKFSGKSVAISIDMGGTDLKSAVVDSTGKILHRSQISSGAKEKKEKILERILSAAFFEADWAKSRRLKVVGAGFGLPGIVSFPQGVIHRSPHFPDWKDFPILARLKKTLPFFICVDNDANQAARGEAWKGAGRGRKSFLLMTLGTGIGGGIFLNRNIFRGDSGFAAEMGHLVIERNGRPCHCGGRGCLEMYASSVGLREDLKRFQRKESPETLFKRALAGDKKARRIYENFGEALGAGIASLVNILDIETVILGGGLSGAWKVFIASARRSLADHTYPTTAKRIRLLRAKLGNDAGLVGAAHSVFTDRSAVYLTNGPASTTKPQGKPSRAVY